MAYLTLNPASPPSTAATSGSSGPCLTMSWLGRLTAKLGFAGGAAHSRQVAKERLTIILAHQRGVNLLSGAEMERLQEEVLGTVKKYISIDPTKPVSISVKSEGDVDVFEMQVALEGNARLRAAQVDS